MKEESVVVRYDLEVREDMRKRTKRYRILMVACAVAMIVGVLFFSASMFELLSYQGSGFPWTFVVGIILGISGGFIGLMNKKRTRYLNAVVDLMDQIDGQESVEISDLKFEGADEREILLLVNALIRKKNLTGYKVVDDKTVTRKVEKAPFQPKPRNADKSDQKK